MDFYIGHILWNYTSELGFFSSIGFFFFILSTQMLSVKMETLYNFLAALSSSISPGLVHCIHEPTSLLALGKWPRKVGDRKWVDTVSVSHTPAKPGRAENTE